MYKGTITDCRQCVKDRIDLTKGNAQNLITIFDQMQLQQKKVVDLLDLRFEDENENWLDQRQKICTDILENVDLLRTGSRILNAIKNAEKRVSISV